MADPTRSLDRHSCGSIDVHLPRVYSRRKSAETPPPDAVYVGRPTPWGNPFPVAMYGQEGAVDAYRNWLCESFDGQKIAERARVELRGKSLVCWCSPKPCHADVLLEVANA